MGVIYLRTNKINGKKYVGQATNLKVRQRDWNCLTQPYAGTAINAARAKYGLDAFDFEILKECDDDELDYWEKYYIKELNTKVPYGYNLTDGGGGTSGYIFSLTEEQKKKISEALKGRKLSEETKDKISKKKKGRKCSDEIKRKIGEAQKGEKNNMYGKHHTDEAKKKMSEKQKGRKLSEETKDKISKKKKGIPNIKLSKPVLQIDKNTNKVIAEFPSMAEVERQLGFSQGNISNCCLGKRKTYKGFIWKYAV